MADEHVHVISIEWKKPVPALCDDVCGQQAQLFAANEFKRIMEPYVPADAQVILARSARVTATKRSGTIIYSTPYAHYQYEGKLFVDPITKKGAFTDGERFWSRPGVPKIPTGRRLHYNTFKHPLATDHWDKAAFIARGDELAEALTRYIDARLR